MQQAYARLILTLVIAGALSCMAGLLFRQIIARVPCQGEGLACNIDEAVGARRARAIAHPARSNCPGPQVGVSREK